MDTVKSGFALDVRMLRIFAAVAASDKLSLAADALGVTPSAVSQAITQIESILGVRVLDRSCRPYKLTSAGAALQRHSYQIVDDVDRLIAQVREADLMAHPSLRIGMIDSFAATTGPILVKRLTQDARRVSVWSGLTHDHTQALLNHQLDIIVTTDALEEVDGLIRRPLFCEPFVLAVPCERADSFACMDLHQLLQAAPMIQYSRRSHFGAMIERHLQRCGVSAPSYLEIDTSDVVMAMVAANLGWAVTTPLCLARGSAFRDQISVLPLPTPTLTRTLYQVSRPREFEELAELCWQFSRSAFETGVLPQLMAQLPWVGRKMRLC